MTEPGSLADALVELQAIAERLRRDCPWDREQDERSIVAHTVEEAYELAEAAHADDDAKLHDELGDVLYQVYFLALLLSERGSGDLASVARNCKAKLVRRHPHVFGEEAAGAAMASLPTDAETPAQVRANWDAIKRREDAAGDPLDRVPENLPSLLYARKIQKRAGAETGGSAQSLAETARVAEAAAAGDGQGADSLYDLVGELLFAVVGLSRELEVDPEIALRLHADRFREQAKAKQGS